MGGGRGCCVVGDGGEICSINDAVGDEELVAAVVVIWKI